MRDFIKCLIYLMLIGPIGFIYGRIVPKRWFHWDRFPFRALRWEKNGAVYNVFGVRRWKEKLPDMSVIFPMLMPSKRPSRGLTAEQLERMVEETCIAEWTHYLLIIFGFGCVFIRRGAWGWVFSVLNLLGNAPYIITQRYNRPKLVAILFKTWAKEREKAPAVEREPETLGCPDGQV